MIAVIDPALGPLMKRSKMPYETWLYRKDQRSELSKRLKGEKKVEEVTFLTNSLGSMWPYLLAGVRERRGLQKKWTSFFLTEKIQVNETLSQGQQNMELLKDGRALARWPFLIEPLRSQEAPVTLIVFPGANYGPSKQWSIDGYTEVIDKSLAMGWQVNIYGTKKEIEFSEDICRRAHSEKVRNYCGKHSLENLLAELEEVPNPVGFCNDSGGFHLLAACDIPVVGLYLSTSMVKTPPAFGTFKGLESDVDCRPCYKRTCPFDHYNCREKISATEVFIQLQELSSRWTGS